MAAREQIAATRAKMPVQKPNAKDAMKKPRKMKPPTRAEGSETALLVVEIWYVE